MRTILRSMFASFSMFSRVPVPQGTWDEEDIKYAYVFFPMVGALEGLLFYLLGRLLFLYDLPEMIRGAVLAVFPIAYTGGIHMDGFLDTVDACFSYGDRGKKLDILKDPHVGGFAVIWGGAYLLLSFAFSCNLSREKLFLVSLTFVISRTLSALSVIYFPAAKREGMLYAFRKAAGKAVGPILAVFLIAEFTLVFILSFWGGVAILTVAAITFAFHYALCSRVFGGITGDLAGFFLEVIELAGIMAAFFLHFVLI